MTRMEGAHVRDLDAVVDTALYVVEDHSVLPLPPIGSKILVAGLHFKVVGFFKDERSYKLRLLVTRLPDEIDLNFLIDPYLLM